MTLHRQIFFSYISVKNNKKNNCNKYYILCCLWRRKTQGHKASTRNSTSSSSSSSEKIVDKDLGVKEENCRPLSVGACILLSRLLCSTCHLRLSNFPRFILELFLNQLGLHCTFVLLPGAIFGIGYLMLP